MTTTLEQGRRPEVSPLVARAKAILAGELVPDPLPLPPDVQAWFDKMVAGFDPPATPEAIIYQRNFIALDENYAFKDVLYYAPPGGHVIVLGCGLDEVRELRRVLTPEENFRAVGHLPGGRTGW